MNIDKAVQDGTGNRQKDDLCHCGLVSLLQHVVMTGAMLLCGKTTCCSCASMEEELSTDRLNSERCGAVSCAVFVAPMVLNGFGP